MPSDAGHDEIEQDQGDGRRVRALEDLQGLLAALGGLGLVAETLDGFFEDAALGWIVVDDQDELGHVAGYSTQLVTRHAASRTHRPRIGQAATLAYAAARRVPDMGKCIVSVRLGLMLFCRTLTGGHSRRTSRHDAASIRALEPCGPARTAH